MAKLACSGGQYDKCLQPTLEGHGAEARTSSLGSTIGVGRGVSAFLALPADVRLRIYSHLFVPRSLDPPTVVVSRAYRRYISTSEGTWRRTVRLRYQRNPSDKLSLEILRTCKQLYHEALRTLYSEWTFVFQDNQGLLPLFFTRLSKEAWPHIRRVQLRIDNPLKPPANRDFHWQVTCAQIARNLDGLWELSIMLVREEMGRADSWARHLPLLENLRWATRPLGRIQGVKKMLNVAPDVAWRPDIKFALWNWEARMDEEEEQHTKRLAAAQKRRNAAQTPGTPSTLLSDDQWDIISRVSLGDNDDEWDDLHDFDEQEDDHLYEDVDGDFSPHTL